ncbi:MAG TPA: TonB family protein [Pyrinomonadaceae bacterium]
MKQSRLGQPAGQGGKWFLIFGLIIATAPCICAQTTPTDAEAAMRRVGRARALAASHNLAAATTELDAIINSTTDDAMRDVARLMLMNIYLEEANYVKADALLVETFQARSAQKESSIRSYFALAGQTINGARAHLDRYRSFGINVADTGLPPEAVNDLDHLRLLLERVVEQAKDIIDNDPKRSDAAALLEEVSGLRASLARNEQERQQWQRQIASARESLAATETRIASSGRTATASTPMTGAPGNPAANTTAARAPSTTTTTTTAPAPVGQVAESRPTPTPTPPPPAQQSDAHGNTPAGTSAPDSQLTNVGSLVDKATQRVSPSYPTMARTARVTGIVTVYVEVDEQGRVAAVSRTDGPQLLKQAAVDAARKWKFKPTIVDGKAVRVRGFINFNFTL